MSLGTVATMVELERTRQGDIGLENTYTLDDIRYGMFSMMEIRDVVNLPEVVVDKDMERKIRNGQVLDKFFDDDMVMVMNEDDEFVAIYQRIDDNKVKPYRMFL